MWRQALEDEYGGVQCREIGLISNPHSPHENTYDCTLALSGPSHLQTVKH